MTKKTVFILLILMIILTFSCNLIKQTEIKNNDSSGNEEEKNIIYVSVSGNDTNPGTKDSPKRTIQAAVDAAAAPAEIHVSHGTYFDSIVLSANLTLLGGYQNGNWSVRDPETYITTINSDAADITIICYKDTKVDGFTINGIADPTKNGEAIEIRDSRVIISNNIINGGSTNSYSYAIYFASGINSEIINNTITGGSASNFTAALYMWNCDYTKLDNNIIKSSQSGNTGTYAYAVYIWHDRPQIENNIIIGGGGTNVYGIYEFDVEDPTSILNNSFSNCKSGLYYDYDTNIKMMGINSAGNLTQNANGTGTVLSTPTGSGNN